jgi:hypothetical protein
MRSAFKLFGLFTSFLFILSITFKDKTLFYHIYDVISPLTIMAQRTTEDFFQRSLSGTKTYSKKIFDNSIPNFNDSVKSRLASPQKTSGTNPSELITDEEKKELDDLIKNQR